MVKDSKSKKPAKLAPETPARRAQKAFVATGRPPGDPLDIRSERLVLRVHTDLLETLTECAAAANITRSLYVEKILLVYLNRVEGAGLDSIGRRIDDTPAGKGGRSPEDADEKWLNPRTGMAALRQPVALPSETSKKKR